MSKVVSWLKEHGADLAHDVAAFVGAGLIAWGIGLVYAPAGVITAGLLMLVGSILHARGQRS